MTMNGFPTEIQDFGKRFVFMQDQRQQADYSPSATFARDRVMQLIDESEDALLTLENVPNTDRRAFAIHGLFRRR